MHTVGSVVVDGDATPSHGLRHTSAGTPFVLLVHQARPVAAVVSHHDFCRLAAIERRDAEIGALLEDLGLPGDLSTEELAELLASTVQTEACRGRR